MRLNRNALLLVVGIVLIIIGVAPFLKIGLPGGAALLVTGVAILAGLKKNKWGTRLLSIWLIASGLLSLVNISVPYSRTILPLLAVLAGILMLVDK